MPCFLIDFQVHLPSSILICEHQYDLWFICLQFFYFSPFSIHSRDWQTFFYNYSSKKAFWAQLSQCFLWFLGFFFCIKSITQNIVRPSHHPKAFISWWKCKGNVLIRPHGINLHRQIISIASKNSLCSLSHQLILWSMSACTLYRHFFL